MKFYFPSGTGAVAGTVFLAIGLSQQAPGQDSQSPNKVSNTARELKGLPPRATPGDYLAHAAAGPVTVAAEFTGHSVATPEAVYTTEDYVAVEVALFGPPETRLKVSLDNFSLRINGKKTLLAAQPYTFVFKSLKDPEWEPPEEVRAKTSLNTGQNDSGKPPPVHMPIAVERAMEQRVQSATLLEAERVLPTAGLIFFQYRGKANGIDSVELIYSGPSGKATFALQP